MARLSKSGHELPEQDARPNAEERGEPHAGRMPLARSSSSVSFAFGGICTVKSIAIVTFMFGLIALNGCSDSGYDKARYNKMQRAIEAGPNKMLGISFTNASSLLSLYGVPWDRGYDNYPRGEWRLYHLRGFYLALHLEVLPPGITPGSTQQFSYQDAFLRQTGVWWVGQWKPSLAIDKLTDPKKRMSNHWAEVERGFKIKSEVLKKFAETNR